MKPALHRMLLRTWLAAAVLLALVFALPVLAQDADPQLSDLQIAVWPEFDQPSVLVIYDGTLDSAVTLPRQLRLPIPAGATVNAVAYSTPEGQLMTLPWEVENTGQGDVVVFEAEQPQFVVEYYADVIAPPPQRSFDLDLALPAAANQVTLTLRQPTGARDLRVEPALAEAGLDELGNPRFSAALGARAAGDVIPLAVDYTKADEVPSLAAAGAAAATAQPAATATGEEDEALPDGVAVALGIALGLVVAAGAIYLINRARQPGGDTRQARRRKAREAGRSGAVKEPRPAPASTGQDQFCRQCGQKFTSGDRFCRNCGATRQ